MSQENVEVMRQVFATWEDDDLEGFIAYMDEELVTCRHPPMPDPGTWYGRAGALDLVAEWLETFDDFTVSAEEYIDAGDHIVVRTLQGGRGTSGGVPVTGTVWFVCGLRSGRMVTWDIYGAGAQALEAAGLSE
jgi:ketosteroid isomerase-like protein